MKPQARRVLRAFLFAILAATPLLAEHLGLRRMWTEDVDERSSDRLEAQANFIEARLESQLELWLHRTSELAAERGLEDALDEASPLGIDAVEAARARAKARLVDVARFTAAGAEAWLVRTDGSVAASSVEALAGTAPSSADAATGIRWDRASLVGRVKVESSSFFEFSAPLTGARSLDGRLAARVVLRVPAEPTDVWLAEAARSVPGAGWVVAVDTNGGCMLDTRGKLLGVKIVPPAVAKMTEWDRARRFGAETSTILRSLAKAPALLTVLGDAELRDPSTKLRRLAGSKLDILVVSPTGAEPAAVAFADQIALALAGIVGLTTFLLVYARLRGTDSWIQPSVGLPAMAGLGFLLASSIATMCLTNTLDERRRDQTRSFGRLVETSLMNEIEGAVNMRSAYFSELDDRLSAALPATVREEFLGVAKLAGEAFPEGTLILIQRDGTTDAATTSTRGPVSLLFKPVAKLTGGMPTLERPRAYTVASVGGSKELVFDAPFRVRDGQPARLLWCIDLSKFLGQLFSPERTNGFDVSLVSMGQPDVAVFPAGGSVSPDAMGSVAFPFPRGDGGLHRLTLTPHVDLFGAETSRMAVLVFGMFISVAGSVAVTLLAGSLASYRRASRIDPLTGVRNRMDFDETLARELERSRRHDRALSLVILDLDYFKRINDEFKHAAGDDVLRTFVMDLTGMLRKTDTVFRYGGEEFAVLLPETTMDAAHSVIDRVRETFASSPMAGLEKLGIVTFSAGVASWDGQESADEFIDRADAAMYEAKNSGRNRVVSARPKRTLRLTGGDRKVV